MALQTMYPGQPNSPQTELASAIDDEQTTIPLLDTSVLPDPPNICTIGTGEDAETVLYEGIDGDDLTGVTRGFQGQARGWSAGIKVARYYTAYDHDAFRQNIEAHESLLGDATATATPNTLVWRDASGRFKAAAPSESDDVARKAETDAVQINLNNHAADYVKHPGYAAATGSANNYAVTLSPAPTAYVDGMAVAVKINVNNTGASTINVNGLGAKDIKKPNGNDVAAGNLKAGSIYTLRYNATTGNFILQGEGGSGGNAQPSDVLSGKTFTNDQGEQVGTMPNRTGHVTGQSISRNGTTLRIQPQAGYYPGDSGNSVQYSDPNWVAANIRNGVSIFGLPGTLVEGKPFATGSGTSDGSATISVSGLSFQPQWIIVELRAASGYVQRAVYIESNYPTFHPPNNRSYNDLGGNTALTQNFAITASGFSLRMDATFTSRPFSYHCGRF